MKGLSDSNLLKLRRQVVHKFFNGRCFFCGTTENLEDHHIIKRRNLLTRYNWRNAILCCHKCHIFAETPQGKYMITNHLQQCGFMEILMLKTIPSKIFYLTTESQKRVLKQEYDDIKQELNRENVI